ncbi:MAG: aldehyde ferredoxin oxidoreductase family protein [Spirochaetes bacterium]|nr:aldehyde ferredoxin oxidoreductase family protein [Spirochaetota bacterium]
MGISYGRALFVDLTTEAQRVESIDESVLKTHIGGSGMAIWLFAKLAPPALEPFDPANPLVFAVGPLCGTTAPTSGRHEVAALSPLTGLFAESDVGGAWGSVFRNTGFDFLTIVGASKKPVSLVITETGARIEDASELWGVADSFETAEFYETKYPGSETACIGPAGERLVRIACVVHDGRDARVAGRCGLGAVMGSKKLKAIVTTPSSKAPRQVHDREGLVASTREVAKNLPSALEGMAKFGTSGSFGAFYEAGDVPVKNWSLGAAALDIPRMTGQRMAESGRLKKRFFCRTCTIGCGRVVELSDGREGGGPEYETISLMGADCMVDDLDAIISANEKANRLGIDTISTGNTIAFLMEAYERGETRGVDLSGVVPAWGSSKALLRLVDLIGRREGIGELLGEGVARASKVIGSPDYAIHVKGLELPGHDPRAFNSMGLSYATANRGGCHLQGLTYNYERRLTMPERGFDLPQDRFGTERKPELVIASQDYMCLMDSLKLCKFSIGGGSSVTKALEWLNLATGWDMSLEEFLRAGERIFDEKRLYNISRGVSRKDDRLPVRLQFQPKGGGAGQNLPPDMATSLDRYYELRGWTQDGVPTMVKLEELGIPGII